MMSASAPHISALTGRRERESHHSSSSSEHHLLNVSLLSYVLPYAAKKIKSPFIFKSVCTSWAETVIHQGAGSNSWKVYFDQLQQQSGAKATVQLMEFIKWLLDHIIETPEDFWTLDAVFFACDKLHFRIDNPTDSFHCRCINATRESILRNDTLAIINNDGGDVQWCFSNFCRLFRGQALSEMLYETLRDCFQNPTPRRVKVAKIIIDEHFDHCDANVEKYFVEPFFSRKLRFDALVTDELLHVWLEGLKKFNKLDVAHKVLLESEEQNLTRGPFLHHITRFSTTDHLQQLLSTVNKYFGDSFLRQLFLQTTQETSYNASYVLSHALLYRGIDCFGALVETASNLGDEYFVDLCLKHDDIQQHFPLFALALSWERHKEAEIILSKIRNIKDPALVRRFVEGNQHLESGRGRELMIELLKKAELINEQQEYN